MGQGASSSSSGATPTTGSVYREEGRRVLASLGLGDSTVACEEGQVPGVVAAPSATPTEAGVSEGKKASPALKTPPHFELLQNDIMRVLAIQCFDGCSFELAKPLSPSFVLRHSILMGSTTMEEPQKYSFGADVGDETKVMVGRMDHNGQLSAQYHQALSKRLKAKVQSCVVSQPGSRFIGDLEYSGKDSAIQLRLGTQQHYGISYVQSITPEIILGGEGFYIASQKKFGVNYLSKYSTKDFAAIAQLNGTGSESVNWGVEAQYVRKVNQKVNLACDFKCNLQNLDSQMSAGYEFNLAQARVQGKVQSDGTLQALLEEKIGPGLSILFSAQVNHLMNVYKFGYGVQIGQ